MLVILDIDGTLANNDHRSHLVDGDQKNWDAFLQPELVRQDAVIATTQAAMKQFQQNGWEIVFLTGRNEGLRTATSEWIKEHYGIDTSEKNLMMRPLGDMNKPTDYKRRQLNSLVYRKHVAWLAIDDDPYMQIVYKEFGAITLHAPECWKILFVEPPELPPETHWRK